MQADVITVTASNWNALMEHMSTTVDVPTFSKSFRDHVITLQKILGKVRAREFTHVAVIVSGTAQEIAELQVALPSYFQKAIFPSRLDEVGLLITANLQDWHAWFKTSNQHIQPIKDCFQTMSIIEEVL